MYDFTNIETFDEVFDSFRKLPLSELLSSAVDRSPGQSTLAIAYLDMDNLLLDDTPFIEQLLTNKLTKVARLALWISEWDNSISLEKILGYLTALKQKLIENRFNFHFVLPNPYICLEKAKLSSISIEQFFQKFMSLANCETQPIEANETAFQLLKRVMAVGVRTNVVLDVSLLDDPLHVAKGPDINSDDDIVMNRVCGLAYELKQALSDYSNLYSVQTFSFSSELRQTLASPFAVPLLRLLCLLRYIFPAPVLLSPFPGSVGKHLYLLLNEFGICSRREGALEVESAKALNLPLLSEISRTYSYAN